MQDFDLDALKFDEHALRHLKNNIDNGVVAYFEDYRFPFVVFIERRTQAPNRQKPWRVWSLDNRQEDPQRLYNIVEEEFTDEQIGNSDVAVSMVLVALKMRIKEIIG